MMGVEAYDSEEETNDRYRTDDSQEDGVEASDGEEQINKRYRDGKKIVKFTVDNETDSSHPVPTITQDDATELKQRGVEDSRKQARDVAKKTTIIKSIKSVIIGKKRAVTKKLSLSAIAKMKKAARDKSFYADDDLSE